MEATTYFRYVYVAGFLFSKSGEFVALIKKNRPRWQKDRWNAIGGSVEPTDRSVYAAMVREFDEECSISIDHALWVNYCDLFGANEDGSKWLVHFFRTHQDFDWHWTDNYGLTDEPIKIFRTGLNNQNTFGPGLPPMVIPNLSYLIPLALHQPLQGKTKFIIEETALYEGIF